MVHEPTKGGRGGQLPLAYGEIRVLRRRRATRKVNMAAWREVRKAHWGLMKRVLEPSNMSAEVGSEEALTADESEEVMSDEEEEACSRGRAVRVVSI